MEKGCMHGIEGEMIVKGMEEEELGEEATSLGQGLHSLIPHLSPQ